MAQNGAHRREAEWQLIRTFRGEAETKYEEEEAEAEDGVDDEPDYITLNI